MRSVAVNGVMAGCAAGVHAPAARRGRVHRRSGVQIEEAGSTPGWEPIVIVSGPLSRGVELQFRDGRPANRPPREQHRRALPPPLHAQRRRVTPAPRHRQIKEPSPATSTWRWPRRRVRPYRAGLADLREDHGYRPEDTVLGVQSLTSAGAPIYTGRGQRRRGYVVNLQVLRRHPRAVGIRRSTRAAPTTPSLSSGRASPVPLRTSAGTRPRS